MEDQHLASLIDLYLAGVLNADERAELHQQLVSFPEARTQFERHISGYRVVHPDAFVPNVVEAIQDLEATSEAPTPALLPSPALVSAKLRAWCVGGAMAVSIMIGLVVFLWHNAMPLPLYQPLFAASTTPIATLRHAAGVEWIDLTNELFLGDALSARRLQIAAGAIQLEFKRGATLVVEAPADLQLVSDNEAFLHSGKVTARVPNTAHGFKITAPAMAVTDLGTEFGVRAMSGAPAEVHVFSGVVEMARQTKDPLRLTEGHASQIRGKRVRSLPSDRAAFLFPDEVLERETDEQRQRYSHWRNAAAELSADPATIVHYTFEDQSDAARYVANRVWKAPAVTAGNLEGCKWTAGRWPEKHAITFGHKNDRVRFSVPNTLTSLTYMAWLRMDQLLSRSNALAVTETMQLGEVHWQVYRDGRVALSSRSGSGSTVDQSWDRGLSPAIFTSERLGKWTHLVSVYDSATRTINHYVNGEFVSSTPIKRSVKLKLGAVEIGNWGVRLDQPKWAHMKSSGVDYVSRYWNGSVDEFALLSRAMTAEEIRRYYQQGRVAAGTLVAKTTP
jgi:hypothetical protein